MARPTKLASSDVDAWLASHPGWTRDGDAIVKRFTFPDFSAALGFAVRVGLLAEKRDHHPDLLVAWGKATVLWTTHDAGGISSLDLELAEGSDAIAA
jgi:4a-hydroxytetrahydrobiopterin dehydratase